jgi:hypothetical protein
LGAVVLLTLGAVCVGLEEGDHLFVIPMLSVSWLAGLALFYFWLRGRFGKTYVLIEPGRLIRKSELFGREKMREYCLDEYSRASLVADFHKGGDDHSLGDPVYHVHVTTTDRPAKFGTFLSREEKEWIVARINRHLGDPG